MILSILALWLAANDRTYVWNEYIPGQTVAFGLPETDDRALRIDCRKDGRLEITGPINADVGKTISLTLIDSSGSRTFRSKVGEDGDGPNFSLPVKPDDTAIQTLMAGNPLWFSAIGYKWAVPGKGSTKLLGQLLKHCKAH